VITGCGFEASRWTTRASLDESCAGAWFVRAEEERRRAPRSWVAQSRSPALADIIGARRMWTVAMISSGSISWK
jgi:hypothetical protein